MRMLLAKLYSLLSPRALDHDLNEELRDHIERETEKNVADGMSPESARRKALIDFGGMQQVKERTRQVRRVVWLEELAQDSRFALRMLGKNPGFTAVALLTLALGIGANTAIFSIVYSVMLKPLPYREPNRLVVLQGVREGQGGEADAFRISEPDYRDWEKRNKAFEEIALCSYWNFNVTGIEIPERIVGMAVTGRFFSILGVPPLLGRSISPQDDVPGAPSVVVLSYPLWQRLFNGRSDVLGKSVVLNSQPTTIIGVMPPDFAFPVEHAFMWTAMTDSMQGVPRSERFLMAFGRLRPGLTLPQAQSEMDVLNRQLELQYPNSNKGWGTRLVAAQEAIVGDSRSTLILLVVAVGALLLIVCANLANLLLARTVVREKELAIRSALGASGWRLARQALTENLLLTLIGALCSLPIAWVAMEYVKHVYPAEMPRLADASINLLVLLFALGLSIATAVALGLLAAIRTMKSTPADAFKQGAGSATPGSSRERARKLIVVAEISASVVLLIGGGLLVRSLTRLLSVNPGFRTENVLTFSLWLTGAKFRDPVAQNTFIHDSLLNIEAIPGVVSAAAITQIPLSQGGRTSVRFQREDRPVPLADAPRADYRAVSPGYFSTMGIPLITGRDFSATDEKDSPRVIIVNQRLAKQWWPGENPIGKRIFWTEASSAVGALTIVGVAGDIHSHGLEVQDELAVYLPYTQKTLPFLRWTGYAVRTRGTPTALWPQIRREILHLDADRAIYEIQTTQALVAKSVAERKFNATLLATFAFAALLLSAIGLYGVIAYGVTQRMREFGIRIALGAQSGDVLRLVLRDALLLTALGLALGSFAAFFAAKAMAQFIFGIQVHDVATFVGVPLLLALVALVACYGPAHRATRIDPMIAIRNE